jgi:hypothetical protein
VSLRLPSSAKYLPSDAARRETLCQKGTYLRHYFLIDGGGVGFYITRTAPI